MLLTPQQVFSHQRGRPATAGVSSCPFARKINNNPPPFPKTPSLQEYQELVAQFKRHEQQLYQFCEEKVTLAHHAADLIQQHQKELEAVSGSCWGGVWCA